MALTEQQRQEIELAILRQVAEAPDGISRWDVGRTTGYDGTATTPAYSRLVKRGFLMQTGDFWNEANDTRRVYITPAGKQFLSSLKVL